jgi:hypothetical protein
MERAFAAARAAQAAFRGAGIANPPYPPNTAATCGGRLLFPILPAGARIATGVLPEEDPPRGGPGQRWVGLRVHAGRGGKAIPGGGPVQLARSWWGREAAGLGAVVGAVAASGTGPGAYYRAGTRSARRNREEARFGTVDSPSRQNILARPSSSALRAANGRPTIPTVRHQQDAF